MQIKFGRGLNRNLMFLLMRVKVTQQLTLHILTQLTTASVEIKGISLSIRMDQDLFSGNREREHPVPQSEYTLKSTVKT